MASRRRQWQQWSLSFVVFFALACTESFAGSLEEEENDSRTGTRKFHTEPHFFPETLTIETVPIDPSVLAPGYIFIAPLAKFFDWGPQIYDTEGTLIFYGDRLPGIQKHIEDFKVCDYLGQKGTHLCLHDGEKRGLIGGINPYGRKAFFDQTYTQVGFNYTSADENNTYPNSHEFQIIDDGHYFLEPVYRPLQIDLRPYLGDENGWLWDACFYEISVATSNATFQWCYLDHHAVWETNLFFKAEGSPNVTSPKAGNGNEGWPWDPLHLNSIDRNAEGDYLVSIRHLDQILKIAGQNNRQGYKPGHTIWRLGGKSNDFDMGALTFSKQHSVRCISLTAWTETLSILDNAWEGTNKPTAQYTAGKIITVDNSSMTAWTEIEYPHPVAKLAESQGNMQVLPNTNVLIDWGFLPEMTEYSSNGNVLWHASYNKDDQRLGWTYRGFKSPWTGRPYWSPKIVAYSSSCHPTYKDPVVVYVSYNGATDIVRWRFYMANRANGPWILAGASRKMGFETKATFSSLGFMRYIKADALNGNNQIIGSATGLVFVPDESTYETCSSGCPIGFAYSLELSSADQCATSSTFHWMATMMFVAIIELLTYVISALSISAVNVEQTQELAWAPIAALPLTPRLGKTAGYHQA